MSIGRARRGGPGSREQPSGVWVADVAKGEQEVDGGCACSESGVGEGGVWVMREVGCDHVGRSAGIASEHRTEGLAARRDREGSRGILKRPIGCGDVQGLGGCTVGSFGDGGCFTIPVGGVEGARKVRAKGNQAQSRRGLGCRGDHQGEKESEDPGRHGRGVYARGDPGLNPCMTIVVQKFGGSSVADLARIGRVADRVAATQREGHQVCVVVSAMGKTTDQLLGQARELSPKPIRRELDMLLSVGERITMALLAIALHERGLDAISFTGSQSGILTNDRHFDARIIEVRPFRIEDELARGRVVIVAGYQGMSYRREITTLGRGGSDTTAVALAAALGADRCEIYSDVDGVYSADPRVVADARHIPAMGYEVLQEMAEAGARVLHAEAVEFARRERIAIYARRTDDPAGGRETVIRRDGPGESSGVRAVVGDHAVAWIRGDGVSLGEISAAAERAQIPFRDLVMVDGRCDALVPLGRVPDWALARAVLLASGVHTLEEPVATVSLVGSGLDAPKVLTEAVGIAEAVGAPVRRAVVTPLRVTVTVPAGDADALTRCFHDVFVRAVPLETTRDG